MTGILRVVATPIGNLDDLSPRAAKAIAEADLIACEDTRVAKTLLTRSPSRAKLVPYHAKNERARTQELVHAVASGKRVALTTDAGMPGLSDPGQRLIAACRAAGQRVEVIPGASAVVTALVASGLPSARFVFEGFLPRTGQARRKRLAAIAREERTVVLFESPHRIEESLESMVEILGPRPAAIARELTKVHEEVLRGTLPELLEIARGTRLRGEITVVIAGAAPAEDADRAADELARIVEERVSAGESKKDAIAAVAAEAGVSKKLVYQAVLDAER